MPFSLVSDTLGRDPRWFALARNKLALRDALQAAYLRVLCETASHLHDGYLTTQQVLSCCDGRAKLVELLCTTVLGGKPFLHRRGESCAERNCIDASGPWVDGFDFRMCGFSKRNPTKAEYTRNQAQQADSRDARLRALVYDRDGGCCRYCRSGPLKKRGMGRARDRRRVLQYDHVDPDQPATPDGGNYVAACGRCNEEKGHRTPDEAELVLLPVPTEQDKAAWRDRGELQFDPPDATEEQDTDKQRDNAHDNQRDKPSDKRQGFVPVDSHDNDSTGVVCPESPDQRQRQPPSLSSEGSGSGRVGDRVVSPAAPPAVQPTRRPDAPDIYHGRSRYPPPPTPPQGRDP